MRAAPSAADRVALGDLVHRYAALADTRRFSELVDLFTADAELVVPEPPDRLDAFRVLVGHEQIIGRLRLLDAVAVTSHEIVGEVYDVDGGSARGRIACVAHHVDGGRNARWHLHYDDVYTRSSDGWRFARRALGIDFIETGKVSRWRGAQDGYDKDEKHEKHAKDDQ